MSLSQFSHETLTKAWHGVKRSDSYLALAQWSRLLSGNWEPRSQLIPGSEQDGLTFWKMFGLQLTSGRNRTGRQMRLVKMRSGCWLITGNHWIWRATANIWRGLDVVTDKDWRSRVRPDIVTTGLTNTWQGPAEMTPSCFSSSAVFL